MTRTIEIEALDHRRGPRIKKIRAEYISAPEVKRRRANLKIAYSRPDFWVLGGGFDRLQRPCRSVALYDDPPPCRVRTERGRDMTNFQIVTQSPQNLADFLYMIQDDALEAKGCSYNLKMPDPETVIMWDEWLKQEAEDDVCVTPRGVVRWAEKGGAGIWI